VGQHTEYLKTILVEKVRKGMELGRAIRRLKKKFADSAADHDRRIDDLRELYEGVLNPMIQREYEFLSGQSQVERDRVSDLEEIEKSGWKP
jgi:hypothetical protein